MFWLTFCFSVVEVDTKTGSVAVKNPDSDKAEPKKVFNFETVYDLKWVKFNFSGVWSVSLFTFVSDGISRKV